MCMICGVANPSHEQAMMTVAALVLGGAGGLLVPWHLIEEPVRKAGEILGRKPTPEASEGMSHESQAEIGGETGDTGDQATRAGSTSATR
jgi:hypothetical protein